MTASASRRQFLATAARLGSWLPAAGSGFALNLATIGAAAAQAAGDYKALVCLFLYGGCDHANTVLATDTDSWRGYLAGRVVGTESIALDLPGTGDVTRAVLPIVPDQGHAGRSFALHPNLGPIRSLFDQGRAAVLANVGPLVAPMTLAQYRARSVPRPPALFSHNDQQSAWQAFGPEGSRVGWGGRMGDLLAAANGNRVFTCISASGNAVFLSGSEVLQYQVSTAGAVGIRALNGLYGVRAGPAAARGIITESRDHLLERALNRVTARSIEVGTLLNNARDVGQAALGTTADNVPAGEIAAQLAIVARIIGGQALTGARRQVFLVGKGGFDNHDALLRNHGGLMTQVAEAVAWFDGAMHALGLRDKVTLFTASDFGRTLTSNGDGSDHGWGSHHFVVGGAVRGRNVYGRFPAIGLDNDEQVGEGRLLPTVSVDQYAATLGRWFGLSEGQLLDILPNLKHFSQRDLGFLA